MSTTEKRAIGVKTIDHVTIIVKDMERSAQFYTNVLGMTPVPSAKLWISGSLVSSG